MAESCLDQRSIRQRIQNTPPLIEGFTTLEEQLQPNGFDLRVREVSSFQIEHDCPGSLTVKDIERRLPNTRSLPTNGDGFWHLLPGPYLLSFHETVNLPLDLMAFGRPRSSLLRSGVAIHTAVWDAGYSGRSQALVMVYHPNGFLLQKDARVMQLVFFHLNLPVEQGYKGRYQGEGTSNNS